MPESSNINLGRKGQFGNVNFNQMKGGIKKTGLNPEQIKLFEKFDTDKNGILSETEMQNLTQSLGAYAKDGKITKHEAGKYLKEQKLDIKNDEELFNLLKSLGVASEGIENFSENDDTMSIQYKATEDGQLTEVLDKITGKTLSKTTVKDGKTLEQILDENGNVAKETTTEGNKTTVVEYDESGNWKSTTVKQGTVTQMLDENGKVLKQETDKGNGVKETIENEYDDSGNLKKVTTKSADGTIIVEDKEAKTKTTTKDGLTVVENTETGEKTIYKDNKDITQQMNLKAAFSNGKAAVTIDGKATGLTNKETYTGEIRLPNGAQIEDGKFPEQLKMTLPEGYNGTMELTLIDAEKGIYQTKAKDRNFQVVVGDDGNVSVKSVNTEALKAKLEENQAKYARIAEEKANAEQANAEQDVQILQPQFVEPENTEATDSVSQGNSIMDFFEKHKDKLKANVSGDTVADNLYQDIHRIGTGKDFDAHIKDITADNVIDVIRTYDEKSPKESLVEAIFDEFGLSMHKRLDSVNTIKEALIKRSEILGVNVEVLNKQFEQEFKDATTGALAKVGYVDTEKLDKIIDIYADRIKTMESLDAAARQKYMDENCLTELKSIEGTQKIVDEMNNLAREMNAGDDILGDGKIDLNNKAIQQTGNCWAHAGINALVATPVGKELINNLITKKDGVIAVKIPEAAGKGLPQPKGDGIYTFSEMDILGQVAAQSFGDGDVTAIMLAISQYFTETGESANLENNMDGNKSGRLFELLTGKSSKTYATSKVPDGVGFTLMRGNNKYYDNLKELLDNGQVAIQVNFKGGTENRTDIRTELLAQNMQKTDGDALISSGHAYAVTKMDNDYVYMIESNNPDKIIKMKKEDFMQIANGVSTYKFEDV